MAGLEVLNPRYAAIWERAQAVLDADPRVRSVSIGGSVGTDTADRWSDLDLRIVVEADAFDAFLADRDTWLDAITPTVFARTPILPFIVNAITADGLVLDIVVYRGELVEFPMPSGYAVGLLSSARFDEIGPALEYAVAEQLRGLAGPFVTFLGRGEHVAHLTGVPHLLGLLSTVFLAELGGPPPPGKRWNERFTDEQIAAVAALPPVAATHDSLVAFGLGLAELVVTRARPLFDRYGLTWPAEQAAATATRLQEALGLDTAAWLH